MLNGCTDGVCLCDMTHLGDGIVVSSVANIFLLLLVLATFQTTLATFFFKKKKHLANYLAIFKMYLATFSNF